MDKIKYQGGHFPIKMGYYALKHTQIELKEEGKDLNLANIMDGDIAVLEPLVFYSLKMGAKLDNTTFSLKREDMEFVLDACFTKVMELLPEAFTDKEEQGGKSLKGTQKKTPKK